MGRPAKIHPKRQVAVKYAFQREILGNLIFDAEKDRNRNPLYLLRNIKRTLRFHKRSLDRAEASKLKIAGLTINAVSSQSSRPLLSFGIATSHGSFSDSRKPAVEQNEDLQFLAFSEYLKNPNVTVYVPSFKPRPDLCLGQSEVYLTPIHLSKRPSSSSGISKHSDTELIDCNISVLLWDCDAPNLGPIYKKSIKCHLETDLFTHAIKIKLSKLKPFKFKGGIFTKTRYHLEIRFNPSALTHVKWPPVPVKLWEKRLTLRGEPGIFRDGLYAAFDEFSPCYRTHQRARVMYAIDGFVCKTHYNLEMSIDWKATAPTQSLTPAPIRSINPRATEKRDVITSFTITSAQDLQARDQPFSPEVRQVRFIGYHCPLCLRPLAQTEFEDIVTLRFHFATAHPTHKVVLDKPEPGTGTKNITEYSFLVSVTPRNEKPVRQSIAPRALAMAWAAPPTPFNAAAYIDGDDSWLGVKSVPPTKGPPLIIESRREALRRQHNGFLPAAHIEDVPLRTRRKYPVVPTRTVKPMQLFTSISHRVLQPEEELSETDDETDQAWLWEKHAQEVMDATHEPRELRRLQIRFHDFKHAENIASAFYCSEVFFRWVKRDLEWIAGDGERMNCFLSLMNCLWEAGKIGTGVKRKCREMVFLREPPREIGVGVKGV